MFAKIDAMFTQFKVPTSHLQKIKSLIQYHIPLFILNLQFTVSLELLVEKHPIQFSDIYKYIGIAGTSYIRLVYALNILCVFLYCVVNIEKTHKLFIYCSK